MTSSLHTCPRCNSRRLVRGTLTGGDNGPRFTADHARLAALRLGVEVEAPARACAECGLLWTDLDARDLHAQLERLSTPAVAAWLTEKPDRPLGAAG